MADFRIHKVVSNLPSQLEANTLYLVRTGEGFDLYCSDAAGAIAYTQNGTLNNITFSDSAEIDFTITGQDITALLKSESISKSKLGTDVKTSLDLADNAVQPADIGVTVQSYNADTVIDANYVATEENFTNTLKIKLDGIEAGATADQTASEILTAIKTVDGSGSGLDADTLDGQQGSYYQPASTALTTTTSFGGDVSGTYNAIVIADDSHNHVISNVDGLQTALDTKAPLVSPALTGTPTAPTAATTTDTTQVATTAFVQAVTAAPFTRAVTAVAALDINCSLGNYFTKTIDANSTFTFSNVPAAGTAYTFTLEITHTSGTITWPTAVKWKSDTAPTLTTGKTHLFVFVTDDGGTRWRGASLVDYVN